MPSRFVTAALKTVPGFGECARCSYRETGPAALCQACARLSLEPLADLSERCGVCDRPFEPGEKTCRNWICAHEDRQFDWNFAIAMRSGPLVQALDRYKVANRYGWGMIFGRVLLGFLEENSEVMASFDLIVASPTYVGPGGRPFDHTRYVLEAAARNMPLVNPWPLDLESPAAVVKVRPTPSMRGKGLGERIRIGREELGPALEVPRPERTRGRSVLVYDDVFTDGTTLNEVARVLRTKGGATAVCGVTLCRQPLGERIARLPL